MKNLKSLFSSPIKRCQMEPSIQFANFLEKNYSLGNKFINGTNLIIDHNLNVKRYIFIIINTIHNDKHRYFYTTRSTISEKMTDPVF